MSKHLNFLKYIDTKETKGIKLVVGTDCSGIDAPLHALDLLGIKYKYEFASDIDQECKKTILLNHRPRVFYDNIITRDHTKLPKLDLYVAGFPCQSFSSLGQGLGFEDMKRGNIFFQCFETIYQTQPEFFILENVKGLTTHDNGNTFKTIIDSLNSFGNYTIYHDLYDTQDYGIPQSRTRIYIIGIRKSFNKKFIKPDGIKLTIGIKDILDTDKKDDYYSTLTDHKIDILNDLVKYNIVKSPDDYYVVDINVSSYKRSGAKKDISPCLLAGRQGYYVTAIRRKTTEIEWLRLQGFPSTFKTCQHRLHIYKQAGNSMSVNVLCFILHAILT